MTDPTMNAITAAVERGRAGERDAARTELTALWREIGPLGDALHRCALAHYLADLHDDPARALTWDIRALDAADSVTDEQVAAAGAGPTARGFSPSLHLNLADNFRRLGSFAAARDELAAARAHVDALADDAYGAMIRTALDEIEADIDAGRTEPRASAPR
ncbi:hypothetical protein [Nocardia puris]|uniref:Tetratricopeptide repeat protein n=1 Tax=Nocardia puris TaxID=208602 RepID=A0A366D9D2_9NOCA|nr:hypothetical protein [Nocardia puris]RBO86616.1 hypothetical protein DFR74_113159 [Nocardia puris]